MQVGYAQGMNDVLSMILAVMDHEADAYVDNVLPLFRPQRSYRRLQAHRPRQLATAPHQLFNSIGRLVPPLRPPLRPATSSTDTGASRTT